MGRLQNPECNMLPSLQNTQLVLTFYFVKMYMDEHTKNPVDTVSGNTQAEGVTAGRGLALACTRSWA